MDSDRYDPAIGEPELHDPYRSAVDRIGIEGNPGIGSRILRYGFDEEKEILGKLYRFLIRPLVL